MLVSKRREIAVLMYSFRLETDGDGETLDFFHTRASTSELEIAHDSKDHDLSRVTHETRATVNKTG